MNHHPVVLWRELDWSCELHAGAAGESRLEIYKGDALVSSELAPSGRAAHRRAEILRQRVLRGDLHAN